MMTDLNKITARRGAVTLSLTGKEAGMRVARIINARLINGTGADPIQDATVTVVERRIRAVDHTAPHTGDDVIDVEGRTVLPGLISAHTHLGAVTPNNGDMSPGEAAAWIFEHLRRALDLGFTTCREVGGIDGGVAAALENGIVRGPRMIFAGPLLVQMGAHADFRPPYVSDPCAYNRDIPGSSCKQLANTSRHLAIPEALTSASCERSATPGTGSQRREAPSGNLSRPP